MTYYKRTLEKIHVPVIKGSLVMLMMMNDLRFKGALFNIFFLNYILHVLIAFLLATFYLPYLSQLPYKPVDDAFELFNAAGLWILFVKDTARVFDDSPTDVALRTFPSCSFPLRSQRATAANVSFEMGDNNINLQPTSKTEQMIHRAPLILIFFFLCAMI